MAKTTWRGGRNMSDAQQDLRDRATALKHGATIILAQSVQEGAVYTQDNLEAATTKTGYIREEATGGSPGRHESGTMINNVSYDEPGEEIKVGTRIWMRFGWWGSNFLAYFREQDLGEGNIPAARALPDAMTRAEENYKRRMRSLVKSGVVDD